MENIVIVGSGPAGLTAAIYAARALLKPVVITGPTPGGQLTQTSDIENFPGFKEPVNGFELMFNFQKQAESFGTIIKNCSVSSIKLTPGQHKITTSDGTTLTAKTIILAMGAAPRWLGLESENRFKAKGVSACATCDGAFFRDVPVVVVGGGDSAMEEACFLTRFAKSVTVIHRRDKLRASKIMANRAMSNPKINFIWNAVVSEILGDDHVEAVKIKNVKTNDESTIACRACFVALGHIPNTDIVKGQLDLDEKGYIKIEHPYSKTNVEGVFAAGDCTDSVYRQAITAAGSGCKAAIDAEHYIENNF